MRLAVYLELPYRRDDHGYSADRAFVRFLLALRPHVDRLVLIGRVDPEPGRAPYPVPADVEVFGLPHYPTLREVRSVLRAIPSTLGAIRRGLDGIDVVWAIGPHPMSIPVALLGLAGRKRVVLGVRQEFPEYVRHRLPSRRWLPAVWAAHALERTFRLLARRVPTVAVGPALADSYRRGGGPVLELTVSLLGEADIAVEAAARPPLDRSRAVELLSVGRLDPEKAPELLLDMLRVLEARGNGLAFRLTVVGTGQLEERLREAAEPLGERVRLLGYVPHGPELFALYRSSDLLVHTARTEGLPQVLGEARAFGLPVVATDVGSVRSALAGGEGGLLVPPGDARALAEAVARIVDDADLRSRLAASGRETALTLEGQSAAVAAFLAGS